MDIFTVHEKTVPQYMYKPVDGNFVIESYVFGIDRKATFTNFVAICETEMEAINLILKLSGIT